MDRQWNLAALAEGGSGYVQSVSTHLALKHRLEDLGLIPGTRVTCMARSPAGDPCAYLIRGALIALRQADARQIALCPAHQRGA